MMNVSTASAAVTEMLPVGDAPHGSRPSRLQNRMKKNTATMYGTYFSPP